MEFYLAPLFAIALAISVSIPNGMEFYFVLGIFLTISKMFQFPTGWNSTLLNPSPLCRRTTSFNSQRDGILLCKQILLDSRVEFQFPTGWNSTLFANDRADMSRSFQFPTGWNSTFYLDPPYVGTENVSIPNGMEFYSFNPNIFKLSLNGFNSQRDGILLSIINIAISSHISFNSQRDGILQKL